MSVELLTYKTFYDPEFANGLAGLLNQQHIPAQVEVDSSTLDASFGNHPLIVMHSR